MAFELPQLPFPLKALEPYITENTLSFHYGKHHQAYITNLNRLTEGTEFEKVSLETLITKATGAIYNNAAQVWNHTFYWNCMSPNGGGEPTGKLAEIINKNFGSFSDFKEKFTTAATSLFGSGWTWLVIKDNDKLEIIQESNAGCPLKNGLKPILTIDVWEHAYYLDYQNRRPEYVNAFWNVIDWKTIGKRIES
ncbi:MAG: superoxide dismutase [Bacteroidota bacterium]|nr:superoxide dismutase [Bacteroidota bacterium]